MVVEAVATIRVLHEAQGDGSRFEATSSTNSSASSGFCISVGVIPARTRPKCRKSVVGASRRISSLVVAQAGHMKLRQSARILKGKALASIRASVIAFNGLDDDGRVTDVLLRMQHAFEMLMKAALNQRGVTVFDKKTGKSLGLDKAINLAQNDPKVKLTDDEAGLIRTIDAMRDEEQHWYTTVDEGILYMHIRAGVTLFDDLLNRVFAERLGNHIPRRVFRLVQSPPRNFSSLSTRSSTASAICSSPDVGWVGMQRRAFVRCSRWKLTVIQTPLSPTKTSTA